MLHILRTKPVHLLIKQSKREDRSLRRHLGALDLTTLGIGAIIGTGIFVLTGVAAARHAGPGVVLSFLLAGVASTFAALVYAELAAMVPVAGSAYTYSYAALGELLAWIIGWDLILEYSVAAGAVSIGWSGYLVDFARAAGLALPTWAVAPPAQGGVINLPAVLVVLAIAALLIGGTRQSASFNSIVVAIKIFVVLLFLAVGATHVRPALWRPFLPFGLDGVTAGAAIIFFAYIGFDAVSTAAEEVRQPARDLPIGIIASLAISSVLYIAVSGVLTGMVDYRRLDTASPLAFALLEVGARTASGFIAVGGLAGLTSVLLVQIFGQSRVFFAMARDGLLPPVFARVHSRWRTPFIITGLTALGVAAVGGFLPIGVVAELANIGTLTAFVLVSIGVMVLRYTAPDLKRPFRTPLFPLIPVLSILSSIYLMLNLPSLTWIRFAVWLGIGLLIYFLYGYRHSTLNPEGHRDHPRDHPDAEGAA